MSKDNIPKSTSSTDEETPPIEEPFDAKKNLKQIQMRAFLVLQILLQSNNKEAYIHIAEEWKPDKEDFHAAFVEGAEEAHQGYQRLWKTTPVPQSKRGHTQIRIWAATPDMILSTRVFPGGYKHIVHRLSPNTIWIVWKFTRPGETLGMAYNGLVWLGDRFKFFPKAWRMW